MLGSSSRGEQEEGNWEMFNFFWVLWTRYGWRGLWQAYILVCVSNLVFQQIVTVDQLTVFRHSLSELGYGKWTAVLSFKQCSRRLFVWVLSLIETHATWSIVLQVFVLFRHSLCIILMLQSYVPHKLTVFVRIIRCKTKQCSKQRYQQ